MSRVKTCSAGDECLGGEKGFGPAQAEFYEECAMCDGALCRACYAARPSVFCLACEKVRERLARAALGIPQCCIVCKRTLAGIVLPCSCSTCKAECCNSCAPLCAICHEHECLRCVLYDRAGQRSHSKCTTVCVRCGLSAAKERLYQCFYCQGLVCGNCHCYRMDEGVAPTHCYSCH